MHGLIIRNGTIIDGSGNDRFVGDIASDGNRITAVGNVEGDTGTVKAGAG